MAGARYPFRIDARWRLVMLLWGVRARNAWVQLDDTSIRIRFGIADLRVAVSNVVHWQIEGPWRWITAIGIRRSIRHGDLSFAATTRGGIRLDLREPVGWGLLSLPAIYVAVDDLEGLAAALAARGIPGSDARTRRLPESADSDGPDP